MRNLLNFIIRYSTWFVFAGYVLLSCIMLFSDNTYQRSIYLTSANRVSSSVFSTTDDVKGYFGLRKINSDLQETNAALENKVLNLEQELAKAKALLGDTVDSEISSERYGYVLANVVNNSTSKRRNFFSIDKGESDGIRPGMGVVNHNGVVGIVNITGKRTARVISLLNQSQKFSVKLKNTDYYGTLHWIGPDPNIAYVEEIPRHVKFNLGDTIVTSGYSTTFPEGIMVGKIMGRVRGDDENFYTLKIKLSGHFSNLSSVRVLTDEIKPELDSLQQFDVENSKR